MHVHLMRSHCVLETVQYGGASVYECMRAGCGSVAAGNTHQPHQDHSHALSFKSVTWDKMHVHLM